MADFTIVAGDTNPALLDFLTYSDGTIDDLTGPHSVSFVMRALTSNSTIVNAAAEIVDAPTGAVAYTFDGTVPAGTYQACWVDNTLGMTFPTVGYLTILVAENLTTAGGASIVALGDVKDALGIVSADRTQDAELLRITSGIIPVVENIVGPVVSRACDEWHDGGGTSIRLRNRPVISLTSVTEYRGPTPYTLSVVATPDVGTTYSVMLDSTFGRVTRRSAGGGVTAFPGGTDTVHVVYTAGRATVPPNIRDGAIELIRVNYQQTQLGGAPPFGQTASPDTFADPGQFILGFFVPNRVREMLEPSKRHPSLA